MNNDELQKAIDDITKETAPAPAEPVAAETEALANEIAGATAPTTGEGVALAPVPGGIFDSGYVDQVGPHEYVS